ncbi:trans-sulfuration enzyme family protein [Flindersiella endophytica]
MSPLHPETRAVHVPIPEPDGSRPLGVPLYQGHLFGFDSADAMAEAFEGPDGAFFYNRLGNPTTRSLEDAVAGLEGGAGALAFGSGMGAISAVLLGLLRSGDHVVAQNALYGGTHSVLHDLTERWNVDVTYISGDDPAEAKAALRPNTKVMYLETLANPTSQVSDLPELFAITRSAGVVGVVDNTFASPVLCRPIEHGADIVVHSVTKYLSGHGDVLGGVAVFADAALHRTIWSYASELGASADPFAAWLTLRGLQTLPLRMARHCANAELLTARLASHPAVSRVRYPALPGDPSHELARTLLPDGCGGVFAFDLAGGREAGARFVGAIQLAALAPSLGAVKTLVLHPASTSHRQLSAEELAAAGIGAATVRVAAGIEHPEDLWTDFAQALDAA